MQALNNARFDVVIIGAGINGASSAQHLSAAGYKVLLVDKGDFASGSSSRSTRMLHCGLRYFETPRPVLDFALNPGRLAIALRMAKASMETRGELAKDSPGRVRAFTLCFPIYRGGPYKAWQLDLAFKVLGGFGPRDVPLDYRRLPSETATALPLISEMQDLDRLHSVATFREYMFDWPERFCLDAALDAERLGATVRNYTSAEILEQDGDGDWKIRLTDTLAENVAAAVRAPIVLNMAGIWIDRVNAIEGGDRQRLIFGTKGAHIVVQLPPEYHDWGVATINSLGEPHYILPSQGGYHHIGPTETPYAGDVDDINADDDDIVFLLRETTYAFPGLVLNQDSVVYSWAGVRPLTYDPAYPKGKRSREVHDLGAQGLPNVFALTAGPIMSHRSAGRELTTLVNSKMPPSGPPKPLDYTPRHFPESPNSPPLFDGGAIKLADLVHAASQEHAVNLSDILVARTGAEYQRRLSADQVRRAAEAVSVELGWDQVTIDAQVAAHQVRMKRIYGQPEPC